MKTIGRYFILCLAKKKIWESSQIGLGISEGLSALNLFFLEQWLTLLVGTRLACFLRKCGSAFVQTSYAPCLFSEKLVASLWFRHVSTLESTGFISIAQFVMH